MNEQIKRPLVIGHRGAYDKAPENSLLGFKKAIDLGADYIEFDVHQSQDGALVIIHGPDILRRMGINKLIKEMTLKELQELDLGDGERVPELLEVIKLGKGKVNFLCEIKAKGITEKVLKILKDEDVINSTIVQSFSSEALLEFRKNEPNLRLALLVPLNEEYIPEWDKRKELIEHVVKLGFPIIATRHKNVDDLFVQYSHKNSLKIFTYTINTAKAMEKFIKMGVDGIIVNSVSKAIKLLKN
ncbi:MAG: glycerophosphodiester phosphodiesterase [Candidatus Thorarchaeota archaeon]